MQTKATAVTKDYLIGETEVTEALWNAVMGQSGGNYHSLSSEDYLFTTTGRYFYGSTDWTIGFRIILMED